MLPTDIQSPAQLLAAALAVEREAVRHYGDMAARMRHYGNHEAVALFERLMNESHERESQIGEWAQLEDITPSEPMEPLSWEDPLVPTTYDAEARDPYRSTPYKALAYAAHNAERAFRLYSYISASATDPQTKRYANILAGDALNRSRLLQSRRRRAYHTEYRGPRQRQLDAALDLKTLEELYAVATAIELRLTDLLTAMAAHYADLTALTDQSRAVMVRCQQQLIAAGEPAAELSEPYPTENIGKDLQEDILMVFAESERAFNFYDTVMAHAYDEAIMLEAQFLSEFSLQRLEAIRQLQHAHGLKLPA